MTAAVLDRGSWGHWGDRIGRLRTEIGELRRGNARRLPPDRLAWDRLRDQVRELPRALAPPAPPTRDRFWASSQKVLAYANRVHATTYELISGLPGNGLWLTYLVEDASGRQARLTWGRDPSLEQIALPGPQAGPADITAGRTPSGYPYQLTSANRPDRSGSAPGGRDARQERMSRWCAKRVRASGWLRPGSCGPRLMPP